MGRPVQRINENVTYHEFYNCIAYIAKEVHLDLFFSDKYTNYILK
jgi:hypothetical protein